MILAEKRIAAFVGLSEFITDPANSEVLEEWAVRAYRANNWFVPSNVTYALNSIGQMLSDADSLKRWYEAYPEPGSESKIGVVLAGNIPAVGFHDILCVLLSGHKLLVKPSKDDTVLIRLILDKLCEIEPDFRDQIEFVERINAADAYIATGSDNTARYFEYYFSSKPHIIRRNRVSVAVLNGQETTEDLKGLCQDIFLYFGLGCRNVSKLYVPLGYDFSKLYEVAEDFRSYAANHHKYFNNYEYNKSILLVNGNEHLDNGFFLIQQNDKLVSPLSMVFYENYSDADEVSDRLLSVSDKIQCVVSGQPTPLSTVSFGQSQNPGLSDYPDGVDVRSFLAGL